MVKKTIQWVSFFLELLYIGTVLKCRIISPKQNTEKKECGAVLAQNRISDDPCKIHEDDLLISCQPIRLNLIV